MSSGVGVLSTVSEGVVEALPDSVGELVTGVEGAAFVVLLLLQDVNATAEKARTNTSNNARVRFKICTSK